MRVLSLLLFSLSSLPAAIISLVDGDALAGGTVTVSWSDGSSDTTHTIQASGDSGVINAAGDFAFEINNDTFGNVWMLTNLRSTAGITRFVIDLLGSSSLFDNGALPRAVGSGNPSSPWPNGLTPAVGETLMINLPVFSNQFNTGDGGVNMFRTVTVTFANANNYLGQNVTFDFNTDTDGNDAVPEPSTWIPVAVVSAAGLFRLRRRA
jgi:hypothetical protein